MPGEEEIRSGEAPPIVRFRVDSKSEERPGETENRDCILVNEKEALFILCDGIGRGKGSAQAAQTGAKEIERVFSSRSEDKPLDREKARELMVKAIYSADEEVRKEKLGGTTVSAVALFRDKDGTYAVIGNAGDSRIYLFREGELQHLTVDDIDPLRRMSKKEAKEIQIKMANIEKITTLYQKVFFNTRNVITNGLGGPSKVEPNERIVSLQAGDRMILVSDGVSDNLRDSEIEEIIQGGGNGIKGIARKLVSQAQSRAQDEENFRRKPDDTSVIAIDLPE